MPVEAHKGVSTLHPQTCAGPGLAKCNKESVDRFRDMDGLKLTQGSSVCPNLQDTLISLFFSNTCHGNCLQVYTVLKLMSE